MKGGGKDPKRLVIHSKSPDDTFETGEFTNIIKIRVVKKGGPGCGKVLKEPEIRFGFYLQHE